MSKKIICQTPELLSMISLGTEEGPFLAKGVHLRWNFNSILGFPQEGFNLFKRHHDSKTVLQKLNSAGRLLELAEYFTIKNYHLNETREFTGPYHCLKFSQSGSIITLREESFPEGKKAGIALRPQKLTVDIDAVNAMPWFFRLGFAYSKYSGRGEIKTFRKGELRDKESFGNTGATGLALIFLVFFEFLFKAFWPGYASGQKKESYLFYPDDGIDRIEITGSRAFLDFMQFMPESYGWEALPNVKLPLPENIGAGSLTEEIYARVGEKPQYLLPPEATNENFNLQEFYFSEYQNLKETLAGITAPGGLNLTQNDLVSENENEAGVNLPLLNFVLMSAVNPNLARVIGLAYTDPAGDLMVNHDYKIEADWFWNEPFLIRWTNYGVTLKNPAPLPAPQNLSAAVQFRPKIGEQGIAGYDPIPIAELNWDLDGVPAEDPARHVSYLVERINPDGSESLLTMDCFAAGCVGHPVIPNLSEPEPEYPYPPGLYQDPLPGFGAYSYRIRGVDLFGRLSAPSALVQISAEDARIPPAPVNARTSYLETGDPALAAADAEILQEMEVPNCLRIEWQWTSRLEEAAPGVGRFNIYVNQGIHNTIPGFINNIEISADKKFSLLSSDFDLSSFPPDSFYVEESGDEAADENIYSKGALLSRGRSFPVFQHGQGPNAFLNVGINVVELPGGGEKQILPEPGACSLKLGENHVLFKDYVEAAHWQGVEKSAGEFFAPIVVDKYTGDILEMPPGLTGSSRLIESEKTAEDSDKVRVFDYRLIVAGFDLGPFKEGHGKHFYQVGAVALRETYSGQVLESPVSFPAGGLRVNREPPPPVILPEQDSLFADKADINDDSYYRLKWNNQSYWQYNVYRAPDVELQAALSAGEQARSDSWGEDVLLKSYACSNKDVFKKLNKRLLRGDEEINFYKDRLPGRVKNRYVYVVRAVSAAGVESQWPALPGEFAQLLTQRKDSVEPEKAAELLNMLSGSFVVVSMPDVTPPPAPEILSIRPGNLKVTISWKKRTPLDDEVAGYRLYRTSRKEHAADIRSMRRIAGILNADSAPENGNLTVAPAPDGSGEIFEFSDLSTQFGRDYYYKLLAVRKTGDGSEVRSLESGGALYCRPIKNQPPIPPAWRLIASGPQEISLQWFEPEEELDILILRRKAGESFWRKNGPWLKAGEIEYSHTLLPDNKKFCIQKDGNNLESGAQYEYKLVAQDVASNQSESEIKSIDYIGA